MTFLRPLTTYTFFLPILLLSTIPIALLAALTTTLAFTLLFLRVLVIYIELFLAVVPHYLSLLLPASTPVPKSTQISRARSSSSLHRRTRRRGSSASGTGSLTPIASSQVLSQLSQSTGPTRDFEGVGGWRLGGDDEDVAWSINSRLELPAEYGKRHHRRSATGGSQEMNTRRVRTPPAKEGLPGGESYFGRDMQLAKGHKRSGSNATGSSGSSKSSSILAMKMR